MWWHSCFLLYMKLFVLPESSVKRTTCYLYFCHIFSPRFMECCDYSVLRRWLEHQRPNVTNNTCTPPTHLSIHQPTFTPPHPIIYTSCILLKAPPPTHSLVCLRQNHLVVRLRHSRERQIVVAASENISWAPHSRTGRPLAGSFEFLFWIGTKFLTLRNGPAGGRNLGNRGVRRARVIDCWSVGDCGKGRSGFEWSVVGAPTTINGAICRGDGSILFFGALHVRTFIVHGSKLSYLGNLLYSKLMIFLCVPIRGADLAQFRC